MTFTRANVYKAVRNVKRPYDLGFRLHVPLWRRDEIKAKFPDPHQQMKECINYFMDHDPTASWRSVIVVLDRLKEKEIADKVRHLAEPVTGEVCCLCGGVACHVSCACK